MSKPEVIDSAPQVEPITTFSFGESFDRLSSMAGVASSAFQAGASKMLEDAGILPKCSVGEEGRSDSPADANNIEFKGDKLVVDPALMDKLVASLQTFENGKLDPQVLDIFRSLYAQGADPDKAFEAVSQLAAQLSERLRKDVTVYLPSGPGWNRETDASTEENRGTIVEVKRSGKNGVYFVDLDVIDKSQFRSDYKTIGFSYPDSRTGRNHHRAENY